MRKLGYAHGYQSNRDYKTKQKNSNKGECNKAKRECRKRYNYICQICGREGLDAHHIDLDETNNNQENLICLCRSCHERVHLNRYLWTGKEYIFNKDYMLETLNPILEAYKDKYKLDGFVKTNSGLFTIKDNKVTPITIEEIKVDLSISKKVYIKKLSEDYRNKIKMITAVRAWNTKVNRYTNKKEWHRICKFLDNYTDDQRNILLEMYKMTQDASESFGQ